MCEVSLRSRLETEPDYQDMVKERMYCAIMLHNLARKICNGSTNIAREDAIGSWLESWYLMMMIRGDECESLLKYLETMEHRF